MSLRSFDIVIFGATGYVGKSIVKYAHQNQLFTKWAILGRNHKKLSSLITELAEIDGNNLPDILIADAQDVRNLRDIFLETRLLLNCIYPFSLYKDIIEACLMARCDYIDLCADVKLIKSNFLEFQVEAFKKGVCIMHGFGFDSAVAELGVLLTRSISGNGACQIVESFLTIDAPKGLGQRQMVDHMLANNKNGTAIKQIQNQIDERFRTPIIKHPGSKIEKKNPYYFEKRINAFASPSRGAEVLMVKHALTANCIQENQTVLPQYHSYVVSDNYIMTASVSFYSSLVSALATYGVGRSLIRYFPEILTDGLMNRERPTIEQIQSTSFEMLFVAKGFMKTVGSPSDSDHDLPNGSNMSDISDHDSLYSTRRVYMARDRAAVDINPGTLPCTFFTPRSRSRSRYIIGDVSSNTPFEKWIKIVGPDPYYSATTILAARLAQFYLSFKSQQATLLIKTLPLGGVLTPSGVFQRLPSVFDHLTDAGIEFIITSAAEEEHQRALRAFVNDPNYKSESEDAVMMAQKRQEAADNSAKAAAVGDSEEAATQQAEAASQSDMAYVPSTASCEVRDNTNLVMATAK